MTIGPLRSIESEEAESPGLDFPLPVADPFVRPMHRECVLKGCAYRSRFLFVAGWGLAALFLLTAVAIGIQSARSQEALWKENALLSQQVTAQREQKPVQSPPPADVSEKEPAEAAAPPASPKLAPPNPASPKPMIPKPRQSEAQRNSPSLPPVPESEKWWNRP
jgi:cytoskeletal protein RodZ